MFNNINVSYVHVGHVGQQPGSEDDFLSLRQAAEIGKAGGYTLTGLCADGIDGAD